MQISTCPSTDGDHPVDRASTVVGGRQKLAELLDVKRSAIGNWKVRGIPAEHCQAIVRLTSGAVRLQELRPNDWAAYWPELAESPANIGECTTQTIARIEA